MTSGKEGVLTGLPTQRTVLGEKKAPENGGPLACVKGVSKNKSPAAATAHAGEPRPMGKRQIFRNVIPVVWKYALEGKKKYGRTEPARVHSSIVRVNVFFT